MDDMIVDIGMEYDLGSGDQHPPSEVQNFYSLLVGTIRHVRFLICDNSTISFHFHLYLLI
jgi:hypothetical protein